jgi:hypothetical protein
MQEEWSSRVIQEGSSLRIKIVWLLLLWSRENPLSIPEDAASIFSEPQLRFAETRQRARKCDFFVVRYVSCVERADEKQRY